MSHGFTAEAACDGFAVKRPAGRRDIDGQQALALSSNGAALSSSLCV